MGTASHSRLASACLVLLALPVAPARPADKALALEGRELVGRPAALVSAAEGQALVLEIVEGQPTARAVKTSTPVYKAFGLNASAERLLYRPLVDNAPSGELVVEELATGTTRRFRSHYALEAAWSPRDRNLLAFTFANGQGYGLALVNVRTRRLQVVWSEEVLADYLAWEADGSGVYYYRAVEKQRTGVAADSGRVVVEHSYAVLTPSFHLLRSRLGTSRTSEEVVSSVLPAGFPVLDKPAAEELAEPLVEEVSPAMPRPAQPLRTTELPADLHAFRVLSPAGDREVLGQNLLADDALSMRELPDGKPRLLGQGRLVRVTESGILMRTANPLGSTLEFMAWGGLQASVATAAAISYGVPFTSAYVTQGGQSFPSPNCSSYYTHTSTSSMGYANDLWNSAGHIMASATGTAVYVKSDVTCNSCAGTACADYRSGCTSNSGWGNVVILEHADGTWTKYTHMRPGSARVSLGESVCAGLWIGSQGHTGCTSGGTCGDHLHFQRQSSSALSGPSLRLAFFDATNPLACYRSYASGLAEASACLTSCINSAVPAADWKGEYFAGTQPGGSALMMVRDEGTGSLGFDWGAGGPGCGVPADGFSARFTRVVSFAAGTQRFSVRSDDGVRVWVDSALLLDKWFDQAPTTYSFDVALTAGSHTVTAEYYESTGSALLQLSWQPVQGVAQFVCDDGDGCFTLAGPAAYWHRATTCGTSALGYGGDMYWTYVNGSTVSNSARWTPALGGPGTYQVSVFVPRCNGTSQQAQYRIVHNGVTDVRAVNQNAYYDAWVTLGSFTFAGSGGESVELTDATAEASTTKRQLAVDAVRWIRQ